MHNWKWFGNAGHYCLAQQCQFHLCTQVGKYLVSTVGEMYFPDEDGIREIGIGRYYETMVFETKGVCGCGCGMPTFDTCEIAMQGYNDRASANTGHLEMCLKFQGIDDGCPR